MQDPSELYRFETDTDQPSARASVMLVSMGGFIDAGRTQRLLTEHLLAAHDHTVVASFDLDQLLDYRGRRPMMTFDRDRFTSYEDPSLLLYRLTDRDGQPFLLLAGAEPDYQWERLVEAVTQLNKMLGVDLTISVHGIPMAVPHTRPLGVTAHATDPRLITQHEPVFGTVQVPASWSALLSCGSVSRVTTRSGSPCTCPTTSRRRSSPTRRSRGSARSAASPASASR